ncbi:MAG: 4'-phosphopantetheinyl transferase superfamily protein [Candidatus Sedimenticola sp. 4PFRAG1]
MVKTPDWQSTHLPTTPPAIDRGDLHVWMLDLAESPAIAPSSLSLDEKARLEKLASGQAKRRFSSSRVQTREILAAYNNCRGGDISFSYGEKGKPSITSPAGEIEFNLSHCGDLALLAVTHGNPVGIDLEVIVPRSNARRIARRVFDQATLEKLDQLEDKEFMPAFFQHWTAMEARVKALGGGVFDFPAEVSSLSVDSFVPCPGWVASIAAAEPLSPPDQWDLFCVQFEPA